MYIRAETLSVSATSITARADTILAGEFDDAAVTLYVAAKRFREWLAVAASLGLLGSDATLQETESEWSRNLRELLTLRRLRQPISASLLTGAAIGGAGATNSEDEVRTTQSHAYVVFQTKHSQPSTTWPVDFALRGRFGFAPAISPTEVSGEDRLVMKYQGALVWDIGAVVSLPVPAKNSAEFSLFAKAGQTAMGTRSFPLDEGADPVVSVPVDNGSGRTEWLFESGLEFNMYAASMDRVHADGTGVLPIFQLALAYRDDRRLRPSEGFREYGNSNQRGVVRFSVDLRSIQSIGDAVQKDRVFRAGFGVEHEFYAGSVVDRRLPPGTIIFLRGDVDLVKALNNGGAK